MRPHKHPHFFVGSFVAKRGDPKINNRFFAVGGLTAATLFFPLQALGLREAARGKSFSSVRIQSNDRFWVPRQTFTNRMHIMTPSTSSAYLNECPAGLSPSAIDEFPTDHAGVTSEWPAPAAASKTVDVHHVLRAVAGEFAGPVRSKRLDFSLRLLARNHYLQTSDPARFRASLTGLIGRAVEAAHAGAHLTVRTSRPADCALRIEVEERSPWMRRAGAAAAARVRRASTASSSSSHVH